MKRRRMSNTQSDNIRIGLLESLRNISEISKKEAKLAIDIEKLYKAKVDECKANKQTGTSQRGRRSAFASSLLGGPTQPVMSDCEKDWSCEYPEAKDIKVQCMAICKNGSRCKRKVIMHGLLEEGAIQYCYMHQPCLQAFPHQHEPVLKVFSKDEYDTLGIKYFMQDLYKSRSKDIIRQMIDNVGAEKFYFYFIALVIEYEYRLEKYKTICFTDIDSGHDKNLKLLRYAINFIREQVLGYKTSPTIEKLLQPASISKNIKYIATY